MTATMVTTKIPPAAPPTTAGMGTFPPGLATTVTETEERITCINSTNT